jgi:hypothetical protein
MRDICSNPTPTHDDMALIPAQGRDPEAVRQDIAAAKGRVHAQRMNPSYPGPQQWATGDNQDDDWDEE